MAQEKKFKLAPGEVCPEAYVVVEEADGNYCVLPEKKGKLRWPGGKK